MTDLLAYYQTRMRELVRIRQSRISRAHAEIAEANRQFDEAAIKVQHEIDKLTPEETPPEPKPQTVRKPRQDHDPSWSQDDIDHFYELQKREQK